MFYQMKITFNQTVCTGGFAKIGVIDLNMLPV